MNIAIDVLAILGQMSKNRGIGFYCIEQLRSLFEQDKENRYFLLNLSEDTSLKKLLNYGDNVSEHFFYTGENAYLLNSREYNDIVGALITHFIEEHDIDLYYITSLFDGGIIYHSEWFSKCQYMITVYDIIPYVYPERYFPSKAIKEEYMFNISTMRSAKKLLVISQSVKDDLVSRLDFPEEQIHVIHSGVSDQFRKKVLPSDKKEVLFEKFGIRKPFIMCTGGDDVRKNIAGLIEAFGKLPFALKSKYQLVIVCKLSPQSVEKYTGVAQKAQVDNQVIFTNFVSQEELLALYFSAYAMAFVSHYEGFGLPVVEAMAAELPVLTSKTSSLGEVGGDAAVLCDPDSRKSITEGLETLLTLSPEQRETYIKKGLLRIQFYSWKNTAGETLSVIREIWPKQKTNAHPRIKVAFFSPLPPIKSGISDYSVDIINELCKYADIDVFVDHTYKPEVSFPEGVRIFYHTEFLVKASGYDRFLYQFGNSAYHEYMMPYLKEYPGVIVLHDFNLHAMMAAFTYWNANQSGYRELLLTEYPPEIADYIFSNMVRGNEAICYSYPVNRFISDYADRLIVHSRYAKENLLIRDVSKVIDVIPLYAAIEPQPLAPAYEASRRKFHIGKEDLVFAAFGHIHQTKRALPILKAFHEISKNRSHARMVFVGQLDALIKEPFEQYIKANKLEKVVKVTGYTTLEDFEAYINAVDICLNLRFPYNGESSASLARILGRGKCVITTDIGSFGEIPDAAAVKLPVPENMSEEEEVEMIAKAMRALLEHPEDIDRYAEAGYAYAQEKLSIEQAAQAYYISLTTPTCHLLKSPVFHNLRMQMVSRQNANAKQLFDFSKTLAYAVNYHHEETTPNLPKE